MSNRLPWYHRTTIYQIYPRSFYDSNGDGIGDLRGIIQKLDYVRDLGFETIWFSPFFASPQQDFGYDISDYTNIAPEYGTLEDALELIAAVHQRGMKIVLDMVMNHTSSEHPWFKESRSSRHNPKADWYIWRDRPNNWKSLTGGSGWHYAPERKQYYWASFLPFQPDLNYRNPQVKQAMFDIVRFWLEKGVDGFRLDIFNAIYKDAAFRDNPFAWSLLPSESNPAGFFQRPEYNLNLPENFILARELRQVTNQFGEKLLLGEVSGGREIIRKFLGEEVNDGLTLVFDFEMMAFTFTAAYFRRLIGEIEKHFPPPFMPVYVFSNHDRQRSIERLNGDVRKAKVLHMLQLTVRGVPCMYYGEEIGMRNVRLPLSTALDPLARKYRAIPGFVFDLLKMNINRDEARTPMQWEAAPQAGFSSAAQTWLPVHANHTFVNAASQSANPDSLLETIRQLLKARRQWAALSEGDLEWIGGTPPDILAYRRTHPEGTLSIFLNFSPQGQSFAFETGKVVFKLSADDGPEQSGRIHLGGYGGLILAAP